MCNVKSKRVNVRLPTPVLDALSEEAAKREITPHELMKQILQQYAKEHSDDRELPDA
jgi:predicted DNA binding CopG/RHH family protein